jgi:hypothetical protein
LIKPAQSPDAGLETRLGANQERKGRTRTSVLTSANLGRPTEDSQGFKPDLGNPAVRDYRGAAGNVSHGGIVNPACNRKSRNGNPSPKARRACALSQPEPLCRERLQTAIGCYGPMAAVVNAMVKRRDLDRVMWGSGRRAKANLWVKHRNRSMAASKPRYTLCLGNSGAGAYLLALWCPVQSRRESDPGFLTKIQSCPCC